jgi:hypothetical protein
VCSLKVKNEDAFSHELAFFMFVTLFNLTLPFTKYKSNENGLPTQWSANFVLDSTQILD